MTSPQPHLRLFTLSDYPGAVALWNSADGITLNDYDDTEAGIARYLKRNPSSCFVLELTHSDQTREIIGAVLSGHDGRRGFIHHLAVAQAHRGRGYATTLVAAVQQALDGEGIAKVALLVTAINDDGNAAWDRLGYTTRTDIVYRDRVLREFSAL